MSQEHEDQEALDAAMFGMDDVTGTGAASVEVTKANRNRFLLFAGIVGALAVMLVMCIAGSVAAYLFLADRKPAAEDVDLAAKKKELPPVTEQQAKIKDIDVGQNTVNLVVAIGKSQIG